MYPDKLKEKIQEEYWLKKVQEKQDVNKISFFIDAIHGAAKNVITIPVENTTRQEIEKLCNHAELNVYVFYLSLFGILFRHYGENDELLFVSPAFTAQHHPCAVNSLLLSGFPVSAEDSFKEIFTRIKNEILTAKEQGAFREEVLNRHFPEGLPAPLMRLGINMRGLHDHAILPAQTEIYIELVLQDPVPHCLISYNRSISEPFMTLFAHNFQSLLHSILANRYTPIGQLNWLSKEEILLQESFNNTGKIFDTGKTFIDVFEAQVLKTPAAPAIEYEGEQTTYEALNTLSNRLAWHLSSSSAFTDRQLAIVIMDRSPLMIACLLAIWKAGGAYIPIDPAYPAERINIIIADAQATMVISEHKLPAVTGATVLVLEDLLQQAAEKPAGNLTFVQRTSDSLAYIIYTSGSTGKPKGVMVEHAGMLNHLYAKVELLSAGTEDIIVQNASQCFDISVWQCFAALLQGGKTLIYSNRLILEPVQFIRRLKQDGVTILEVVPSYLSELLEIVENEPSLTIGGDMLKYLLVTGEVLPPTLVKRWFVHAPGTPLVNAYGPTEASDDITHHVMHAFTEMNRVPIGKTVRNFQIYILNEYMQKCPIGAKGEIAVTGIGVGKGYLNNPEKTAAVFMNDPFRKNEQVRLYKTGDIGRYLPDGTLELFGRKDFQVKIRGYRIEPEEVTYCLNRVKGIKSGVVLVQENDKETYLAAFYTAAAPLQVSDLNESMKAYLPAYMLPAYYIHLPVLPLTPTGKIDINALKKYPVEPSSVTFVPPTSPEELQLAGIWQDILQLDKVGLTDNFFQIGGNSLKGTKLIYRVHKEFEVKIALQEIFSHATITLLLKLIASKEHAPFLDINPVPRQEHYPLSPPQKRMFILDQFEDIATTYNIPAMFRVTGNIHAERLEQTIKTLILRHDAFRTSFAMLDEGPVQIIQDTADFTLTCQEARESEIMHIKEQFIQPFDLTKAPLLRARLIKLSDSDDWLFFFDMHHIITDGASIEMLLQEFLQIYAGETPEPLRIQYKDYVVWQQSSTMARVLKQQEDYWLRMYANGGNDIPVLNLPTDFPRPSAHTFQGASVSVTTDYDISRQLETLEQQTQCTTFIITFAVYAVLLSKYAGQEDLIIGTPVAGRTHAALKQIVGLFVNTAPVRSQPEGSLTFREFLMNTSAILMEALQHQDYPLEDLVDHLHIKRNTSRNPLFDVLFTYEEPEAVQWHSPELSFSPVELKTDGAKLDMIFEYAKRAGKIQTKVNYNICLYKESTMRRMLTHYQALLKTFVTNPDQLLSDVQLSTPEEQQQILADFNNTRKDFPQHKTLSRIFEEQVEKTPDNIAVAFKDSTLTYTALNERANQLARKLRSEGVTANTIVAIMAERSLEMAIGILAILKAGGAYLPVSPDYPENRIKYLLEDSGAGIILTQEAHLSKAVINGTVINLNNTALYSGNTTNLPAVNTATDLIYVIYTSGSTGKPKGTLIEHRGVVNYLYWRVTHYNFQPDEVILQKTPFTFDASISELFSGFFVGGTVYFLEPEGEKDPELILRTIENQRITTTNIVPSMLSILLEYLQGNEHNWNISSLRNIMSGGESLNKRHADLFNQLLYVKYGTRLHNLYGPTEASIAATYFDCSSTEKTDSIPIGNPLNNVKVLILNKQHQLQPIGVPGELFISGEGVRRGYLNRPELNLQKFLPDPFHQGSKMYSTGDQARWLENGRIEYLGRMDFQVKIRGYRIETGEIENCLRAHPQVKEVIVTAGDNKQGEKQLCAYLVMEEGAETASLRKLLLHELPEYMVPAHFIKLDHMPLTSNGKIDRQALPEPAESSDERKEYVAPSCETEATIAVIWQNILGIPEIGINDNFFEIGGHSLKVIQLIAAIHKKTDVKISIVQVFQYPTIKELARIVKEAGIQQFEDIEVIPRQDYYDLSFSQKRFWILDQYMKDQAAFNITNAYLFKGLNPAIFEKAFHELVNRHESIRTVFSTVDGAIKQKINTTGILLQYKDLSHHDNAWEMALKIVQEEQNTGFDLEKGPLLRAQFLILNETAHVFICTMHHIIADGWSIQVMLKEMKMLYNAYATNTPVPLPPPAVQYVDYAAWVNKKLTGHSLRQHQQFWWNLLSGELPVLHFPLDYERPDVKTFNGDTCTFELPQQLADAFHALSIREGASLFMVLLASLHVLVYKYTGEHDIIIGTDTAGRVHAGLEDQIGLYLNTLALRNRIDSQDSFRAFLQQVKSNTLQAFEYQLYPFEQLIDDLKIERNTNRLGLFDIMILLQNFDTNAGFELAEGVSATVIDPPVRTSKFDILFEFIETDRKIICSMEYNTDLFSKSTITRIKDDYLHMAQMITENSSIPVAGIELSPEDHAETELFLRNMQNI